MQERNGKKANRVVKENMKQARNTSLTALPEKHGKKKVARKLARKYEHTDTPVKDKNGKVLTTDHAGDDLKRSTEHFGEQLHRPPHQKPSDVAPAEEVRQINCDRPSKTETEKTSHHMKSEKLLAHKKFLPV